MNASSPSQWIATCAVHLHARWRTVPTEELEEVAVEIWRDPNLRALAPDAAAALWLAPICPDGGSTCKPQ